VQSRVTTTEPVDRVTFLMVEEAAKGAPKEAQPASSAATTCSNVVVEASR
jgi:hypothetical protein